MFLQLRVENHRSLRDEATLFMVAEEHHETEDPALIQVPGLGHAGLPVTAIYGPNAAGKSAILHAFAWMKQAVLSSDRYWSTEAEISREPFALSEESIAKETLFEIDLVLGGVRYRYGFTLDDHVIREEWLYTWPHGRKQIWFTRDHEREPTFEFGKNLRGENRTIEKLTRPNSLFLSAAAQNAHEQLRPLFRWFETGLCVVGEQLGWPPSPMAFTSVLSTVAKREAALDLLRRADLGIMEAKVEDVGGWGPPAERRRLLFRHTEDVDGAWLRLDQESMGTQALVNLLAPMFQALSTGGLLVVDELGASLHPALEVEIVNLFQSPHQNPLRAQLLFNTHNTTLLGNLLGESPLRRDQVWFVEKGRDGASRIFPLSEYHTRPAENVERGYLQGRYGAMPFAAPFAFAPDVSKDA